MSEEDFVNFAQLEVKRREDLVGLLLAKGPLRGLDLEAFGPELIIGALFVLELPDNVISFKGVEKAGVKDAHQDLINSQVVPVQDVETVSHHSEAKVARCVALIAKVVFIEVDLSKVEDRIVSAQTRNGDF